MHIETEQSTLRSFVSSGLQFGNTAVSPMLTKELGNGNLSMKQPYQTYTIMLSR